MASEFKAEPIANSLPSDHLTWRPVTVLQPSFKVTHAYTVFDLGFLDSHRDNGIRCNMTNPFAGPEDFEALSDRIVRLSAERLTAYSTSAVSQQMTLQLLIAI